MAAQISCPKTLNPKGVSSHLLYKRPYIFSSKDDLAGSRSEIFWVVKTCHFAIKKGPWQHGEENFLENFPKKLSHLEEGSYEMAKIFGGFGQISSFEIITFSK